MNSLKTLPGFWICGVDEGSKLEEAACHVLEEETWSKKKKKREKELMQGQILNFFRLKRDFCIPLEVTMAEGDVADFEGDNPKNKRLGE